MLLSTVNKVFNIFTLVSVALALDDAAMNAMMREMQTQFMPLTFYIKVRVAVKVHLIFLL
jgi:hypothetical protein